MTPEDILEMLFRMGAFGRGRGSESQDEDDDEDGDDDSDDGGGGAMGGGGFAEFLRRQKRAAKRQEKMSAKQKQDHEDRLRRQCVQHPFFSRPSFPIFPPGSPPKALQASL
jgi:hypothetical protein